MSELEGLRKALADAQRYLGELQSPPNEANTCDWVIRPLLLALGYENYEIHSQAGDSAREFPDYTILPKTDHTWYLEAKAWTVGLDSIHVDQSLNYAHRNGHRWVVLSNGREWRLYDDHIQGKNPERLVSTAMLEDTDGMIRFLNAVSRDSIQAKKVESYASERRVRDYLAAAISDPKSPVVQAVLRVVKQNLGNGPITADAIVDILNARQAAQAPEPEKHTLPSPAPKTSPQHDDKVYGPLFIKWRGLFAEGTFKPKSFIVKKGAKIAKKPVPSYALVFEKKIPPLISSGLLAEREDHLELLSDIEFKTPSGASGFVFGASRNGWDDWYDEKGVVLNKLCPRTKEEKWREGWSTKNPKQGTPNL